MQNYVRKIGRWLGQCWSGGDQYTDESSGASSPREQLVRGNELMGLRQVPEGARGGPVRDYYYMTRDTIPWDDIFRPTDEDREIEEQKAREERDAPEYGTVTMVRNKTRCALEVYAGGESEYCLLVWRGEQAALPRRCDVNAELVIKSEWLGQAIELECVIDRLRNQNVNVTADDFGGTYVRVVDREDYCGEEAQIE